MPSIFTNVSYSIQLEAIVHSCNMAAIVDKGNRSVKLCERQVSSFIVLGTCGRVCRTFTREQRELV